MAVAAAGVLHTISHHHHPGTCPAHTCMHMHSYVVFVGQCLAPRQACADSLAVVGWISAGGAFALCLNCCTQPTSMACDAMSASWHACRRNDDRRGGGGGGSGGSGPTGPMSFKQFLMERVPDDVGPKQAQDLYDQYLTQHFGNQLRAKFEQEKGIKE